MIKRFFKDSFLYTISSIFTKGIAFIMLPIYLSYLSKREYGIFDYIMTVGSFLGVVITLEISQAVMRFASEFSNNQEEQRKYISNGVVLTIFVYLLLFVLVHLKLERVSEFFTGSQNYTMLASLAVLAYAANALMYLSTIIYRTILDAKSATFSAASSAAVTSFFSFILLKYFNLGVSGILLGLISGQLSVAIINFIKLRRFLYLKLDLVVIKSMLKFSTPLVFSSVGVIMAIFSDKLMIKHMLDFKSLGEYAVAAKFAAGAILLTVGFQSALSPLVYGRLEDPDTPKNLRKLFLYYVIIGLFFSLLAFFLAKPIVKLVTGDQYIEAIHVLPLLFYSVLISSGYMFFPGLSIEKKTHILAGVNLFAGVFNLLLNLMLIPLLGIYGAALATLVSAILSFFLNVYFSEKYYPIF